MKFKLILLSVLITVYAFASDPNFKFSDMVKKSDLIVKAKVLSTESKWVNNPNSRHIYTTVQISVDQYIKGSMPGNTFSLDIIGGKVGDTTEVVSSSFGIQKGENVILFLNKNPLRPFGFSDSKISLREDNVFLNSRYVSSDKFISVIKGLEDNPVEMETYENVEKAVFQSEIKSDIKALKQDEIDFYKKNIKNENKSGLLLALPDLQPYKPGFVADLITVKKTTIGDPSTDLTTEDSPLYDTDNLYLAFSVANMGSVAAGAFTCKILLDGAVLATSSSTGLNSSTYTIWYNVSVGSIAAGSHTLKLVADYGGTVAEGNEANNEYSRSITISHPAGSPTITSMSPSSGSAGTGSTVTITGSGFGAAQGAGVVEFYYKSGQPKIPASVTSWSDNQIVCDIPIGTVAGYPGSAGSGPVTVTTNGGSTSNGYSFTVTFGYGQVRWAGAFPTVGLKINENYAGITGEGSAVQAAASTWTGVGANFAFQYAGTSTATDASADGFNTICWGSTAGSLATAYYWFSGSDMAEADIVFNNTWTWSSNGTGYDVQGIATHELGHWLNLRDLYGTGNASQVMYGFGSSGEVKRTLSSGDAAGIAWIYGSGGPPPIPTAPTLTSPADAATGQSISSTGLAWDASSGATSYGIQVSTNTSFTSLFLNTSGVATTSYTLSGLSNSTTYYWRVNATNSSGTSAWSSYRSFTTISGIPLAPVLSSPSNSSTNVSLSPNLTWNAAAGATSYQLKVATDAGFSGIVFNQSGLTSTSRALSGLSYGTTYYWAVCATNAGGTGPFSGTWSFTTMPANYNMSGQVALGGSGLTGVTLNLTGTTTGNTVTDAMGNYSFSGSNGGNYTITPSKQHYSFSPATQSFNPLNSDKTQNFTATLITYSISGTITSNGSPLAGVTVALTGTTSATATTAANGTYTFTGLTDGGNYTVTPAKTNYSFLPVSQTYTSISENKTLNFSATFITYTISGTIKLDGASFFGVTLNLTGSSTSTKTSIEDGSYSFSGLLPGGNYTVTPVMANYTFTPESQIYNALAENKTLNFEATALKYSISGVITSNGQPLANATVSLSGSSTASATTNASGAYTFTSLNPGGNYTVTPAKTGYSFSPVNAVFNSISENKTQNFTANLITYSITGIITTEGSSISGVTLTLTGSATGTTTSSENGSYTFSGLPAGGSYTITPALANYTFNPANSVFNNLSENKTQNFSATVNKFNISGSIKVNGSGLSGVLVTLSGSKSSTITTSADGAYSFTALNAGGNYTVTPSKENYSFTPLNGAFNNLTENKVQDFSAAYSGTFSISGIITSGGTGLSGVTITLSGSSSGSVTSGADGSFLFAGLAAGGNYTITPSKINYTFNPANAVFNSLGESKTQNFAATLNTYSITGVVTFGGAALANVSIALTGSSTATASTDASGAYTFNNLGAGGSYTITPSKSNYSFTPVNAKFDNLSENKAQNFAASFNKYSISGVIRVNGTPLSGVMVSITGEKTSSITTESDGTYAFTDLSAGGNYTISPVKTNYSFTPVNAVFNNLQENKTQDFTASFTGTYTISGTITLDGAGLSGVTVTLSGTSAGTTTTAANGSYTLSGLTAGGNYTITPTKDYYSFTPINAAFNGIGENKTQNFTASLNKFTISGTVKSGSNSLPGVTISLSGASAGSQVTDASGYYVFNNLNAGGNYTLTPSKTNYKFEPVNKTFSLLSKNEIQDFSGTPLSDISLNESGMPNRYSLEQNYPNPFNPGTRIDFTIPENSFISIKIFNSLGIEVETLLERNFSAGKYSVSWNPGNLPSGVYYYELKANKYLEMKKMLYLR
jgi:hypothetical protein